MNCKLLYEGDWAILYGGNSWRLRRRARRSGLRSGGELPTSSGGEIVGREGGDGRAVEDLRKGTWEKVEAGDRGGRRGEGHRWAE